MFILKDGTGGGYSAKVTKGGKLRVLADNQTIQSFESLVNEAAFQAFSGEITVSTAGEYGVLALRNDSTETAIFTYIRMGVDSTETAEAKFETIMGGTWNAGTAASIINMNVGSNNTSGMTAHYNSIPTSGDVTDLCYLKGPNEMRYSKEGSVVLRPGEIIAVKVTTSTNGAKVYARMSFVMIASETIADRT